MDVASRWVDGETRGQGDKEEEKLTTLVTLPQLPQLSQLTP